MNKFKTIALTLILSVFGLVVGCQEDTPSNPTMSLSETEMSLKAGDLVNLTVTYEAEAGAKSLNISKMWDGQVQGQPTVVSDLTSGSYNFSYEVSVEDADYITTFNFTLEDDLGNLVSSDLVLSIELTPRQMLLKYDWALNDEIRVLTNSSDISDAYTDDVYRFNEDGSFQRSVGAKEDAFGDLWYKHCNYDFDEESMILKLHSTGAFADDQYVTIHITSITKDIMEGDVTYIGLDVFNTEGMEDPYQAEEQYIKKFSSVAKGSSFDPYRIGVEDDVEGPSATPCNDADFTNN